MHMEEVNCNDNWRNSSYWEEFQVNNPEKATEVIALGIDPDTLSDKDVKEVIFAIEIEAEKLNCSISDLKKRFLKMANFPGVYKLSLLSTYTKRSDSESAEYNIQKENTINSLYTKWLLELITQEEKERQAWDKPITQENPTTLLMKFALEGEDEILHLQKLHIYHNCYPRDPFSTTFLWNVEKNFDTIIEKGLQPIMANPSLKNDKVKFNLAIDMQLDLIADSIKNMENLNNVIETYNKQYISFYVELDLALKRAREKNKL